MARAARPSEAAGLHAADVLLLRVSRVGRVVRSRSLAVELRLLIADRCGFGIRIRGGVVRQRIEVFGCRLIDLGIIDRVLVAAAAGSKSERGDSSYNKNELFHEFAFPNKLQSI